MYSFATVLREVFFGEDCRSVFSRSDISTRWIFALEVALAANCLDICELRLSA